MQDVVGLLGRDHRLAKADLQRQRQHHHHRHHQQHIAQHCRYLRAHQVGHLVSKHLQRVRVAQVFELGRHGGCGHGRLLGGQRQVQQLDHDEAGGIGGAGPEAAPERRQAQRHDAELEPSGDGGQGAAAGRLAQHVAVLGHGAGDVVLAGLRAALGHLGRQHRGVGINQGAQAAPRLAHRDQVRQQTGGAVAGVWRDQAVQQTADAQHPFSQLAQLKHQVD